jgi:hypothetical protein
MKKTAENRYPHSATLFKFCKEALEIRYEGNVKVIDQDVGAILKYDPADCSHWKKGKKNIRSLSTLRSIADHLNIDERLLIDIASGRMDLNEAVFEYRGYGSFNLQGRNLETLKKEFFRNPAKWQDETGLRTFEEMFDVRRENVADVAGKIFKMGAFAEAPVYLPEVIQLFSNITLTSDENLSEAVEVSYEGEAENIKATFRYRGTEMRPYIRFAVAKELFKFLVKSHHPLVEKFLNCPLEVLEIQANVFAGMLLIPAKLLKADVETIDGSLDIVLQLADTFWVSKALMNQRLRDYMEYFD